MMSLSVTCLHWSVVMQIINNHSVAYSALNHQDNMQTTKNAIIKIEPPENIPKEKLAPLRQNIISKNKPANHTEARDELASRKIFKRLQTPLPQIHSPYLKQTVTNLFPYQMTSTKNQQAFHFQKYSLSILDQMIRIGNKAHRIFNSADFAHEINQQSGETRIIKSFSEAKTYSKLNSQKQSSPIMGKLKIPTQNSSFSLQRFSKQPQRMIPDRSNIPLRQSSFVLKHKLAHSLYSQERSELKVIQSILASREAKSMGKSLKVKNYTKFASNIINIQT